MLGRFSSRLAVSPVSAPAASVPLPPPPPTDTAPPAAGVAAASPVPAPPVEKPVAAPPATALVETGANAAVKDKILDAKIRLHRRLIEELNLAALEKLPEAELRREISGIIAQ
jgi:pilus assembly protein CpaF